MQGWLKFQPRRRDGYAFPMALAAIMVISLIVAVAASQIERATRTYLAQAEALEIEIEARSAEQTFLYHALTSPMGARGVEVGGMNAIDRMFATGIEDPTQSGILIPGNGRARRFSDRVVLRYIDQQGFLPAAHLDSPGRLEILGVPRIQTTSLAAALADYQDEDPLRRPGGAEALAYSEDGMPPNRPFLNPLELCRVAGWAEQEICNDRGRLLLLAARRPMTQLNAQFASPMMIDALLGEDAGWRETHAMFSDGRYTNFADIHRPDLDEVVDIFDTPTPATGNFALVAHDREAANAWISVYELTPQSVRAPFSLSYRYRIGGDYVRDILRTGENETIQPLPEAG